MRIFDCFCFNGEKNLLEIRLNELKQLDANVIHIGVISGHTFTGQVRKLPVIDYGDYPDFNVQTYLDPSVASDDPWVNETNLRNYIKTVLSYMNPTDDDIVIISDVDEIPSAYTIARYKPEYGMVALQQDLYYYYLNVLESRQSWRSARIMTWEYLKDKEPDAVRRSGFDLCLMNGGQHYTYMGGIDAMLTKFKSFSHQEEDVQKFASKEALRDKIESMESIWGSKLSVIPIDDTMPLYVRMNQEKLKGMMYVQ